MEERKDETSVEEEVKTEEAEEKAAVKTGSTDNNQKVEDYYEAESRQFSGCGD